MTATASTFDRADVIQAICGALPTGGTRSTIEDLTDQFLARPEVIELQQPEAGEVRYTVAELLELEQKVVELSEVGVGDRWKAPTGLVHRLAVLYPDLNDDQMGMVTRFVTSGAPLEIGVGPPGSGKTTVMAAIGNLAVLSGAPVVGAAVAAKAAVGLQAATCIPSSSLAALEARIRGNGGLAGGSIVVIDEASMVGTRQLAALCNAVEAVEGKLILIGDPHQLPELKAGGLFRLLSRSPSAMHLGDNLRQREPWERQALAELRDGSVDRAISAYRRHRRLIVGADRTDTLQQAVSDWHAYVSDTGDPAGALMLAHDKATVADLNDLARRHFAASGILNGPTLEAGGKEYRRGDRIICLRNHRGLGVLNGDLGTVTDIDTHTGQVTVRLDRDPETVVLPVWYQDDLDYGYAITGHKAQGVTVDRTFSVIGQGATRQWFHVAMSRGRHANTAYVTTTSLQSARLEMECTHVPHLDDGPADPTEAALARIRRDRRQTAGLELF